jgi:hypothetical protein
MIPIRESAVVGLLHWISVHERSITSFDSIDEVQFTDLVARYERSHGRPFDLYANDNLVTK